MIWKAGKKSEKELSGEEIQATGIEDELSIENINHIRPKINTILELSHSPTITIHPSLESSGNPVHDICGRGLCPLRIVLAHDLSRIAGNGLKLFIRDTTEDGSGNEGVTQAMNCEIPVQPSLVPDLVPDLASSVLVERATASAFEQKTFLISAALEDIEDIR